MKIKSLMMAALAFFAVTAHADDEVIKFSLGIERITLAAPLNMRKPSYLKQPHDESETICFLATNKPGTELDGMPVKSNAQSNATVLPLERTEKGLKVHLTITKRTQQGLEWVAINDHCKLPVGATNHATTSIIQTFAWNTPTEVKLSDGSMVRVLVSQSRMVRPKLGHLFEKWDGELPVTHK
ncbi:MAG: hypothetical protein RSD49_17180 [Hafnia sp.]